MLNGDDPLDGGDSMEGVVESTLCTAAAAAASSSSSAIPHTFPFIDMKGIRTKRNRATFHNDDAATPSTARDKLPPARRKRMCVSTKETSFGDGVEGSEARHTPALEGLHSFASVTLSEALEQAEGTHAVDGGDQPDQMSTPGVMRQIQSLQSPLGKVSRSDRLERTIQSSDTDEKLDDWPASFLAELDDIPEDDTAKPPHTDEVRPPFIRTAASSPTARSETLPSTFESRESTIFPADTTTFNPQHAPEPGVSLPSDLAPTWAVLDVHNGSLPPSEEEVDELMSNEAMYQSLVAAYCSDPRTGDIPVIDPVTRPAAAILRALGPPRGNYALEHLYTSSSSTWEIPHGLPPRGQEACASNTVDGVMAPGDEVHHGAPEATRNMDSGPPVLPPPPPPSPPPAPAQSLPPPPPSSSDPVVEFLQEIGLRPTFAEILHRVGISDNERIRAIGALKRAPMDRIDRALADEGLDLVSRVLIREGLKNRAALGSK